MALHYYCRVADHIYLPYCFRGWPIWPYITIARYGPYILNLLLQELGNIFHLTITGAGPYISSSYSRDGLPCATWNDTSICQTRIALTWAKILGRGSLWRILYRRPPPRHRRGYETAVLWNFQFLFFSLKTKTAWYVRVNAYVCSSNPYLPSEARPFDSTNLFLA